MIREKATSHGFTFGILCNRHSRLLWARRPAPLYEMISRVDRHLLYDFSHQDFLHLFIQIWLGLCTASVAEPLGIDSRSKRCVADESPLTSATITLRFIPVEMTACCEAQSFSPAPSAPASRGHQRLIKPI